MSCFSRIIAPDFGAPPFGLAGTPTLLAQGYHLPTPVSYHIFRINASAILDDKHLIFRNEIPNRDGVYFVSF